MSLSISDHIFFLTERCVMYYRLRMQRAATRYRVLLAGVAVSFGFVAAALSPSLASAEEYRIGVVTAPVFSSSVCPVLPVASFTPYIYEGKLHSFDIVLGGSMPYVPVLGSAGSESFGFSQFSRVAAVPGKFHVDIAAVPLDRAFPLTVSLLSPGAHTCLSVISIQISGSITSPISPLYTPTKPVRVSYETPSAPVSYETDQKVSSEEKDPLPVVGSAFPVRMGQVSDYCKMGGAARVWLLLIALYAVFLTLIVLYREKLPQVLRTDEALSALIVGPFLLLFAVWYLAPFCRAATWVPFFATALAIGALLLAFRATVSHETDLTLLTPGNDAEKNLKNETPKKNEEVIHLPEGKK
jgi:hypothetical protein